MPRKKVPISKLYPYHITARCNNRELFPLALDEVWGIMENYLFLIHKTHGARIHAFVLMPNHFHLLVKFPFGNLGEAMNYFMGETSRRIAFGAKRINRIYGTRCHRTLIDNGLYFLHAYKYVYRNPVKANLVSSVDQWPYSTLFGAVGNARLVIPIEDDTILFPSSFDPMVLHWLNRRPEEKREESVRRALRRQVFSLPRLEKCSGPNPLETEQL